MRPTSGAEVLQFLQTEGPSAAVLGTSVAWYAMRPPEREAVFMGLVVALVALVIKVVLRARRRSSIVLTLHEDHLTLERGREVKAVRFGDITKATVTRSGVELLASSGSLVIPAGLEDFQRIVETLVTRVGRLSRGPGVWAPVILFLWWLSCVWCERASIPVFTVPLLLFSVPYAALLLFGRGLNWPDRVTAVAWLVLSDWVPLGRLLTYWDLR